MDGYKTVKKRASDEYTVKKSRFIGSIAPVTSVREATEFIDATRKKYWDATHNVYAYRIRNGAEKYSDDGEPRGTAGVPVLKTLEQTGLTDCAAVITRYFGGVRLGTGGLIRAYSRSASAAASAGEIITRIRSARMKVECDYRFYGKLASLAPQSGCKIEDAAFSDLVAVVFLLPASLAESFNARIIEESDGKYRAEKLEELFADAD